MGLGAGEILFASQTPQGALTQLIAAGSMLPARTCNGSESSILDCPGLNLVNNEEYLCRHVNDIGVQCADSPQAPFYSRHPQCFSRVDSAGKPSRLPTYDDSPNCRVE